MSVNIFSIDNYITLWYNGIKERKVRQILCRTIILKVGLAGEGRRVGKGINDGEEPS